MPSAKHTPATFSQQAWEALYSAFHRTGTPIYRRTQAVIWTLIIASILLFGLDLMLDEGAPLREPLKIVDKGLLIFFGLEIGLRIVTYRPPALHFFKPSALGGLRTHLGSRLLYCLEPLNLIDIMTVLAVVPALRGLRALRLLRLLRTTRLLRYSNPFAGLVRAFEENGLLFAVAFSMVGTVTIVGGISIYLVEGQVNDKINSVADGLYWALVTLTTVGFGDISPMTTLGRTVAGALMIAGMFTLALFAGIVGNTLLNTILTIREEQFRMSTHINHVIVCGYDPGARMLLNELINELGSDAREMVIFAEGERPSDVPPELLWLSGDPTKESELDKVRLAHASAVVLVGSRQVNPQQADAVTILTIFTLRSYLKRHALTTRRAKPLYIVAEILDAENVDHARAAGADEVIETTRLGFSLMAHAVAMPGTAAIMSRVAASGAHSLYVGVFPPDLESPMSFEALARHLKHEHGGLLLGIRDPRNGVERLNPPDEFMVDDQLHLLYLAERPSLPDPAAPES